MVNAVKPIFDLHEGAKRVSHIINPYRFGGGAAFTYYSTVFDGSDNLVRGSDLTGNADGQAGILSVWLNPSVDGTTMRLITKTGGTGTFYIRIMGTEQLQVYGDNSSSSAVINFVSAADYLEAADGWVHVLAAWDLSTAGRRHIYINDTDRTGTVYTFTTGGTIAYSGGTNFGVCGTTAGADRYNGLISELYFALEWIDITNASNRAKFISGGKPVNLGTDGSTPTGTAPIIYLKNQYNSFQTNAGSGGNFTVSGSLGDGGADIP